MITILVLACVHSHNAMCVEVAVPTLNEFGWDDPSYHENYLVENYPRFEFRFYICGKGYFV
jgi:hypothetical protein